MPPLLRYTLLQLPALAAIGFIALLLWRVAHLPGWVAASAVLLWVVKDVAMYPLVRGAYAGGGTNATARLVGQCGIARQALAPGGYVVLGNELWRAEVEPGAAPIAAGHAVRVTGTRRLTLIVAPADEA